MPSKVRLIVQVGSTMRAGPAAKEYVRQLANKYGMPSPVSWKEYVRTVEKLPLGGNTKKVLVLRDPRKVALGKSRYMQICAEYGLRVKSGGMPQGAVATTPSFLHHVSVVGRVLETGRLAPQLSSVARDVTRVMVGEYTYVRSNASLTGWTRV